MKKILFIFALFYSNASFAACFAVTGATTDCAQATEYQVSVSKVELCADAACTSAVTVADTTASFDIATAAVGAQVGAYANLNTVPVGTYTHIRSAVSSTITYAGDATANCTAKTSTTATLTSSGGGGERGSCGGRFAMGGHRPVALSFGCFECAADNLEDLFPAASVD